MPSPIGHALGGLAAGSLVARGMGRAEMVAFAVAGALADVDFLLPITHRGPSHGLGAAVLVFAVVAVVTARVRLAAAIAAAYASHTLLDWLGADGSSPRGLMALWPVTQTYYVSGLDLFAAVDRRYWLQGFWTRNALAVVREIALLAPAAVICASAGRPWRSCRRRATAPPRASRGSSAPGPSGHR